MVQVVSITVGSAGMTMKPHRAFPPPSVLPSLVSRAPSQSVSQSVSHSLTHNTSHNAIFQTHLNLGRASERGERRVGRTVGAGVERMGHKRIGHRSGADGNKDDPGSGERIRLRVPQSTVYIRWAYFNRGHTTGMLYMCTWISFRLRDRDGEGVLTSLCRLWV